MPKLKFGQYVEQVFSTLPADQVVRKTMSGNWTAHNTAKMLNEQNADARAWLSDLLRVFRDLCVNYAQTSFANKYAPNPEHTLAAQTLDNAVFKALLKEIEPKEIVFKDNNSHAYSAHALHVEFDSDSDVCVEYKATVCRLLEESFKEYASN